MNWPLMRRSRAVPRARYEQVIDQRDEARTEAAQHVDTIVDRSREIDRLREQLAAAHKRNLTLRRTADTAVLARRLDVAHRAGARILAAYVAEKRRADHLQARLDDACGLNHPALDDGRHWQSTRSDTKGAMS